MCFRGTVILIVYTCAIIVTGGIGNSVLIYVHFRRRPDPRSSSKIKVLYHFIFMMALLDLVACTIILPTQVYSLVFECQSFSDIACKLFAYGRLFCVYASMFILIAIAIDRYISVCFPFVESATITMRKAHMLTVVALASAAVAAVPNLLVFEITHIVSSDTKVCQPNTHDQFSKYTRRLLLLFTVIYLFKAWVVFQRF